MNSNAATSSRSVSKDHMISFLSSCSTVGFSAPVPQNLKQTSTVYLCLCKTLLDDLTGKDQRDVGVSHNDQRLVCSKHTRNPTSACLQAGVHASHRHAPAHHAQANTQRRLGSEPLECLRSIRRSQGFDFYIGKALIPERAMQSPDRKTPTDPLRFFWPQIPSEVDLTSSFAPGTSTALFDDHADVPKATAEMWKDRNSLYTVNVSYHTRAVDLVRYASLVAGRQRRRRHVGAIA